jgi:hypothetical protein
VAVNLVTGYPGRMRGRTPTINVDFERHTFVLAGVDPEKPPVTLNDVEQVAFFKRDELTTDLICCEITLSADQSARTLFLHEEVPGWNDLIALLEHLPGFDRDWWAKVAKPPFVENRTVAFRNPSASANGDSAT